MSAVEIESPADADDNHGFVRDDAKGLAHARFGINYTEEQLEAARVDIYEAKQLGDPIPWPGPVLTRLSGVEPQLIRWLWAQRIARGKLTLVFGEPGLGKSFFSIYLIARTTSGGEWPDGTEVTDTGSAIIISAEDDLADTIRPRLDAAGADVSKVVALEAVRSIGADGRTAERSFTLADIGHLRDALNCTPNCRLVIIDPVSAYLGGKDGHRNDEIRGLLAPLAKLAAAHGVAIVMITHSNKGAGARAVHRAMGSLAFLAAARAAWLVVRDEARPDRRMLLPVKNNIGDDKRGFAFSIVDGALAWERDAIYTTADQALSSAEGDGKSGPDPEAMEAAKDWLMELLKAGPVAAATVKEECAAAGMNYRTVHRAKDSIGVRSYREQFGGAWTWKLTEKST